MSPTFYYVLHLLGIVLIFLGYGALIARSFLQVEAPPLKRLGSMTSGIGLLLVLVAGFGLQAKLGYGLPPWLVLKIVVWLALGAMTALINRQPRKAQLWWWLTAILGLAAIWLVYHGRTLPALASW